MSDALLRKILLNLILVAIAISYSFSQSNDISQKVESPRAFRAMFYNCENYFDVVDDSLTSDEEYLPTGERHWDEHKFYKKSMNISKVITGVGGWVPVDLIGLCEVENRMVLDKLIKHTPIFKSSYKLVHKESPDKRGIDVALLYNPKTFVILDEQFINVKPQELKGRTTRDILYAKGLIQEDTIHVFVNHWPSRWGGQLESEGKRIFAAQTLRAKIDSIFSASVNANVLIMGDLNDEPHDRSVKDALQVISPEGNIENGKLYNMMIPYVNAGIGTHKYQGKWGILDHLIISGSLLNNRGMFARKESASIYDAEYLLTDDQKFLGIKPHRTYVGYAYKDGYSDHLPVFIDFYRNDVP